jgi:hypothetical protein
MNKTRSGNKEVDKYIELLEEKVNAIKCTNTIKLLSSIDLLAGKISADIDLMVAGERDDEDKEVEVSHKLVDTFLKLVDKTDKINAFSKILTGTVEIEDEKPKVIKNIQDYVLNGKTS